LNRSGRKSPRGRQRILYDPILAHAHGSKIRESYCTALVGTDGTRSPARPAAASPIWFCTAHMRRGGEITRRANPVGTVRRRSTTPEPEPAIGIRSPRTGPTSENRHRKRYRGEGVTGAHLGARGGRGGPTWPAGQGRAARRWIPSSSSLGPQKASET
jgi:hypothetical protein